MLLALETATPTTVLALIEAGVVVARETYAGPGRNEDLLLPTLDTLLAQAGCDKRQLQAVAAGVGPGGFTSLRVGLATAKGVAFGMGLPLYALGTLRTLARGPGLRGRPVATLMDARRGEVFVAAYAWVDTLPGETPHLREVLAPAHMAFDDAVRSLADVDLQALVGDGVGVHAETLARAFPAASLLAGAFDVPTVDALAAEAWEAFTGGTRPVDDALDAVYLRPPDAALPKTPLRLD